MSSWTITSPYIQFFADPNCLCLDVTSASYKIHFLVRVAITQTRLLPGDRCFTRAVRLRDGRLLPSLGKDMELPPEKVPWLSPRFLFPDGTPHQAKAMVTGSNRGS